MLSGEVVVSELEGSTFEVPKAGAPRNANASPQNLESANHVSKTFV